MYLIFYIYFLFTFIISVFQIFSCWSIYLSFTLLIFYQISLTFLFFFPWLLWYDPSPSLMDLFWTHTFRRTEEQSILKLTDKRYVLSRTLLLQFNILSFLTIFKNLLCPEKLIEPNTSDTELEYCHCKVTFIKLLSTYSNQSSNKLHSHQICFSTSSSILQLHLPTERL